MYSSSRADAKLLPLRTLLPAQLPDTRVAPVLPGCRVEPRRGRAVTHTAVTSNGDVANRQDTRRRTGRVKALA